MVAFPVGLADSVDLAEVEALVDSVEVALAAEAQEVVGKKYYEKIRKMDWRWIRLGLWWANRSNSGLCRRIND